MQSLANIPTIYRRKGECIVACCLPIVFVLFLFLHCLLWPICRVQPFATVSTPLATCSLFPPKVNGEEKNASVDLD